ncbi:Uncharacterised protein [Brucella melitensis]|nr:Uncharacterised protein [Brucella melitensis]
MAQDVADNEFTPVGPCTVDYPACIFNRCCQRLLDEHVRALLHGRNGIFGMAFRIGGDTGQIGLQLFQRLMEGRMNDVARQFIWHRNLCAVDEPDDFKTRIAVIGKGMAAAHIAEAG